MAAITDALGKTTHIEYDHHLKIKKTDRNGQTFFWEYETVRGGDARCVHTWGDGGLQEGWIEGKHTQKVGMLLLHNSIFRVVFG